MKIGPPIVILRGRQVILDSDLASVYGVPTKRLNEQVRRNKARFPADFMFRLTRKEIIWLKSQLSGSSYQPANQGEPSSWSQIATSSGKYRGAIYLPYAFTEHGALMAATVLSSSQAIKMSIFVVRAFVGMREQLSTRSEWEKRLLQIENILLAHDDQIRKLFEKIRPLLLPPPEPELKRIGFHVREKRARYEARRGGR